MSTIVHVNKQHVAMNAKDGGNRPIYIVREGRNGKSRYAREVRINGPSRFVYDGTRLRCGARAWLETESTVELIGEASFSDARAGSL